MTTYRPLELQVFDCNNSAGICSELEYIIKNVINTHKIIYVSKVILFLNNKYCEHLL